MVLIEPDFSEAVESLPAGEYPVRVVGCEQKDSKAGNVYLNWTLETFGKSSEQLNGRKVFHTTPITGKGAGILKAFVKACGMEVGGSFDTEELMGAELVVVLAVNPDRAYPEVKAVKRWSGQAAA